MKAFALGFIGGTFIGQLVSLKVDVVIVAVALGLTLWLSVKSFKRTD